MKDPLHLAYFQPINIIGCLYKVIVKVLAERLKVVMPDVISETQSTFIHGRQITYGVLIINEAVS